MDQQHLGALWSKARARQFSGVFAVLVVGHLGGQLLGVVGQGRDKNKVNKTNAFPQYQDMLLTNDGKDTWTGNNEGEEETNDELKQIQRYVNVIRKAEGKRRKLQDLRQQRDLQWSAFQDELKKAFVEQKRRYTNDVKKMDSDAQEIQRQRDEAAKALKQFVGGGGRASSSSKDEGPDQEDLAAWNELIAPSPAPTQAMEVDPWVQELFQRTTDGGITDEEKMKLNRWLDQQDGGAATTPTRPTTGGAPRTPAVRFEGVDTGTPPRPIKKHAVLKANIGDIKNAVNPGDSSTLYVAPGNSAASDPYMGSPAAPTGPDVATFGVATASVATTDKTAATRARRASPATPRTLYGTSQQRIPVKLAKTIPTRPSPKTSARADFMDNKRGLKEAATASAMAPQVVPMQVLLHDDDSEKEIPESEGTDLTTL